MLLSTFLSMCSNSNNNQSPIEEEEGCPKFIQYIETPPNPEASLYNRFKQACIQDDIDTAESIIKVDTFFRNEQQKTTLLPKIKPSLSEAQTKPLLEVKKTTLETPWLLSKKDEYGCDILFIVASRGLANVTSMLLNYKANPHSKNGVKEKTPLYIGIQNGHQNVVQLLLERSEKSEINAPCDILDNRPLHIANQNYDMTNLLFIEDANIYVTNNSGKAPDGYKVPSKIREPYEDKKKYDKHQNGN